MKAMDNFRVEVRSMGRVDLERAVALATEWYPNDDEGNPHIQGAAAWKAEPSAARQGDEVVPTLTLYSIFNNKEDPKKGVSPFPVVLKGDAIVATILDWLESIDYPEEPDIDGSCSKGWHLVAEMTDGWSFAFMSIRPEWAHHHK